jgi:hypothetical protein
MVEKASRTHESKERQKSQARRGNGDDMRRRMEEFADETAESTQRSVDRLQQALGSFWEEAGQEAYGPILRNVARANLELIGWMGRRAQAAAEMPGNLVRCQTPQDILSEQGRFLQDIVRDCTGTTTRMLSMWSEAMPGGRERPMIRK